MPELIIANRFNGPPTSGNGGYVCGSVARFIDGAAEVSLRAPAPLDVALEVQHDADAVSLRHGDTLIAEARSTALTWEAPPAPTLAETQAASPRYRGFISHIFPGCFACGPARRGDGLAIFPGDIEGRDMVAAPWTPRADETAPEFIWAALDCPTYWALPRAGKMLCLLARMSCAIDAAPPAGEPLIVAAWPLAADGRKHTSRAALYRADGAVIARAEALWVEPKAA